MTDFIKVLDSRERGTRFRAAGPINEPGMAAGSPDEFGLWLDIPADPKTQAWRRNYVKNSFEQIGERMHVSQRGQAGYRGGRDAPMDVDGYGSGGGTYGESKPGDDKPLEDYKSGWMRSTTRFGNCSGRTNAGKVPATTRRPPNGLRRIMG